jgi:hypothetical protein
MTIFLSARARQIVDAAIQRLPNPADQQIWKDWSYSHPNVKTWNNVATDQDIMPSDVAVIVASALALMASSIADDIRSRSEDDDELGQLDNIHSYVRLLETHLKSNRVI